MSSTDGPWSPPNPEAKAPGPSPSEREVELYLEDADLAPFKPFTIARQKALGAVALVAVFFLFFAITKRPLGQVLLAYGLPLLIYGAVFFCFMVVIQRSARMDDDRRRFWLSVDDRGFATRNVYGSMSHLWAGTLGIQEMPTAFLILLSGSSVVLPKRQLDDTMQEKLRELARRHPPETPKTSGGGIMKTLMLWVLPPKTSGGRIKKILVLWVLLILLVWPLVGRKP